MTENEQQIIQYFNVIINYYETEKKEKCLFYKKLQKEYFELIKSEGLHFEGKAQRIRLIEESVNSEYSYIFNTMQEKTKASNKSSVKKVNKNIIAFLVFADAIIGVIPFFFKWTDIKAFITMVIFVILAVVIAFLSFKSNKQDEIEHKQIENTLSKTITYTVLEESES